MNKRKLIETSLLIAVFLIIWIPITMIAGIKVILCILLASAVLTAIILLGTYFLLD